MADEEWKKYCHDIYYVARQRGTKDPWTSAFESSKEVGTLLLCRMWQCTFKSDTKFESGCGWPSFYEPISKGSIIYAPDNSYGMNRTEVMWWQVQIAPWPCL